MGPTGVGKTALAVDLAKKFNGSLISADSVQVYKSLDIISGKDSPIDSKFNLIQKVSDKFEIGFYNFSGIKVYLLDIINPSDSFSVYDFLKVSSIAINAVLKENKLPIIVGGTGLYVEKLKTGLDTQDLETDIKLRNKLQKMSLLELQEYLQKLNLSKFQNLNNSDVNNPRRLIRAIEILVKSKKETENRKINKKNSEHIVIGLMCNRQVLKKRIDKRVDERLKNGALKEAKNLYKTYDLLSSSVKNANGYKQLFSYLKKEIDLNEAISRWKISEYRHAKNQMTWFRKYGETKWFDINTKGFKKDIEQEISSFLA